MSVLVVYESMFGNTRAIAEAVADGLRTALTARGADLPVDVVEVTDAPASLPQDIPLLVVGGPTHAFSMSRESTREDALRQAHVADAARAATGLREWIAAAAVPDHVTVVTFDTRVKKAFVPGSGLRADRARATPRRRLHSARRSPGTRPVPPPVAAVANPWPGPRRGRCR